MLINALVNLVAILLTSRAEKAFTAVAAGPIVELASTLRSSRTPNALRNRCHRPAMQGG